MKLLQKVGLTQNEQLEKALSGSLQTSEVAKKSPDFDDGIQKLLNAYKEMGCRMSLEFHFLHSSLDFFPETLGEASDEQGERCQQDIKSTEHRYQGFWNDTMMQYYCRMLYCDDPDT